MTTSKKQRGDDVQTQSADLGAVDRAVVRLHTMVSGTAVQSLTEIGHFLLDELDAEGTRAVLRKCDSVELPVSRTFLTRAIAVARLERRLPEDARFRQLSASHRVELVAVRDPIVVERLASIAVERRLSVQKLRSLVRREVARSGSTRGPKPVVEVLRVLRKVRGIIAGLPVGELSQDQRAEVGQLVEEIVQGLRNL